MCALCPANADGPRVPLNGDFFYYWNIFFTGTIIFVMMFFFKVSYEKKETELLLYQNHQIRHQKEEIEVINEKARGDITDRTEKIRSQENCMSEYAHIHAYQVRSPLARILGFIHLIDKEPDPAKAPSNICPKSKPTPMSSTTSSARRAKHRDALVMRRTVK